MGVIRVKAWSSLVVNSRVESRLWLVYKTHIDMCIHVHWMLTKNNVEDGVERMEAVMLRF